MLKNDAISDIQVPKYSGISVKKIWDYVKGCDDLMVYFPDLDEGQLPERKYIFRVLSAQRPIQLTKLVKQAWDNRAIENSSQDDMMIEMTADVKETILSLLPKKSKLLCCSYSSFQPAKVELISS